MWSHSDNQMVEVITDGKPFEAEFARAMGYYLDLYTPNYITEKIADGNMQCFRVDSLIIVTQVEEFPNGKILRIVLVAGNGAKHTLPLAEGFFTRMAEINGCKAILTSGRVGWAKYARKLGWTVFNEYRKEMK